MTRANGAHLRDRSDELMKLEPSQVMARFHAGLVSRRDVLKVLSAVGMVGASSRFVARPAAAQEDLNIICWAGYTDESFAKPFEDANDAKINSTFAASSDEMFASLQASGGETFDLVSASNDLTQRLVEAELVLEIDPATLTNFDKLYEQFQKPPYITFDEKLYGVNFAWGPTYMIYNPDEIEVEPTSWRALLDEQYEGKIAAWNAPIQIAQYALLLDPKPDDPYALTDEQLEEVKAMLLAQRPLLRLYWGTGIDLAEAFVNNEVVIADAWPWITLQIKDSGGSVATVLPEEGVTGWSDSWMISKGAQNPELALKWADYMIGEQGQMGIVNAVNYSITNKEVVAQLTPEQRTELRLDNIEEEYNKILMWKKKDDAKWLQVWQEATAG
jgi:putative spermidine/putrescine transport system substrate-binding protein/spermidine/putrescine transport system substrate-binding protein